VWVGYHGASCILLSFSDVFCCRFRLLVLLVRFSFVAGICESLSEWCIVPFSHWLFSLFGLSRAGVPVYSGRQSGVGLSPWGWDAETDSLLP